MTVPTFVQSWKLTGNNDYAISLSCGGIVGGPNHALVAIGLRWGNTAHEHFFTMHSRRRFRYTR